jgi:hypothetical protein
LAIIDSRIQELRNYYRNHLNEHGVSKLTKTKHFQRRWLTSFMKTGTIPKFMKEASGKKLNPNVLWQKG